MARQATITEASFCDLCAAAEVEAVPATHERLLPGNKKVADLCDPCVFVWDIVGPRLAYVQLRLAQDVIEKFFRITRLVEGAQEPPARVQRALSGAEHTPAVADSPEPRQEALELNGPAGDEQYIYCLDCEPRRRVFFGDRKRHARIKHETEPHAIVWESGTVELNFPCRVHPDCDETGYALDRPQARAAHERSSGLPKFADADNTGNAAPAKANTDSAAPAKAKRRKRGTWVDGTDQVGCPLEHREGAQEPYWVHYTDRTDHAHKQHGLNPWEIAWSVREEPGDTFTLDVPCTEHEECKKEPGYHFPTETGLDRHIRHWAGQAAKTVRAEANA